MIKLIGCQAPIRRKQQKHDHGRGWGQGRGFPKVEWVYMDWGFAWPKRIRFFKAKKKWVSWEAQYVR